MATRNGTPGNDTLTGTASADQLFGLAGNDSLLGLGGIDNLEGGIGNDTLNGGIGNDTLSAGTGNDKLFGGRGSDRLNGGNGNDTLTGSTTNLVGERDTLTGGTGVDLFVLGNATQVFYDDRNRTTAGRGDYALVTDFNTNADVIQLKGTSDNYVLARSPAGLPAGTAIYLDKSGSEPDELIAIVQGSTSLSLDRDYFKFTAEFDLADLNGSNGFKINGINAGDDLGSSVSSAGDVNGDGFDDLIIGTNKANTAGESYVVFGKAGGFSANLNLSALDGSNGFKINGIDAGDFSGRVVSEAGDVNGDGFDDLIIGAFLAAPNGQEAAGESYVVFGKAGGFSTNLNLSALNGSNGFKINGIDSGDLSGDSVSSAGDVNGDGFDDIIIGAFGANPDGQTIAGESYVVFGSSGGFSANFNLSALNGSNGFKINGINSYDRSGLSVSNAGDVNSDGFDDLIIGALSASPNGKVYAGESYVVFGKAGGFSTNLNGSNAKKWDRVG